MLITPAKFAEALTAYIDNDIVPLFPNWSLEKMKMVAASIVITRQVNEFMANPQKVAILQYAGALNEDKTLIDLNAAKTFALDTISKTGEKVELPLGIELDSSDIEKIYAIATSMTDGAPQ